MASDAFTVAQLMADLQMYIDRGMGDRKVTIYCANCDLSGPYQGASGSDPVVITVNEE